MTTLQDLMDENPDLADALFWRALACHVDELERANATVLDHARAPGATGGEVMVYALAACGQRAPFSTGFHGVLRRARRTDTEHDAHLALLARHNDAARVAKAIEALTPTINTFSDAVAAQSPPVKQRTTTFPVPTRYVPGEWAHPPDLGTVDVEARELLVSMRHPANPNVVMYAYWHALMDVATTLRASLMSPACPRVLTFCVEASKTIPDGGLVRIRAASGKDAQGGPYAC